jgi:hypothetical protein
MYTIAKPFVVRCNAQDPPAQKKPTRVQRLRREIESKRIENLKKIQDVFRKTAEDDLETLLAFVRNKDNEEQ